MNLNGTFPFTLTWVQICSSPSHICPRCCSSVFFLVCVLTKLVSLGWIWREEIWAVHRKKDASPSLRHKELLSKVEREALRLSLYLLHTDILAVTWPPSFSVFLSGSPQSTRPWPTCCLWGYLTTAPHFQDCRIMIPFLLYFCRKVSLSSLEYKQSTWRLIRETVFELTSSPVLGGLPLRRVGEHLDVDDVAVFSRDDFLQRSQV